MSQRDEYAAETEIKNLQTQLNALKELNGEELLETAASHSLVDSTIRQMLPQYKQMQLDLADLGNSGLGDNHPRVKMLKKRVIEAKRMLDQGVEAVRKSLDTKLKIAAQSLENIKRMKEGKESDAQEEQRTNSEYVASKNDYEMQQSMLVSMKTANIRERVDFSMPKDPIEIHEKAEANPIAAKPMVALQLALGGIVGLVFGIGLAFFLEYLDTSVKTLEDVERYLGVPVLAVIPRDVGLLHKQSGLSPDAEAYRILRTNIEFNRKSADANAITVVSGGAGEGKSTTLVNLAYICAQGGYNTLMIDGDLRRPKLHTFFDINNSVGLTNYLTTDLMLEDVILQTPIDNLYFMPSGILPADAAGILNSRRMSELIADVKNRFDLILIDSPPILGVSDASVLASEVDLTMIVIQHRKLPRSMLVRVKQAIENVGGNLLGVVLNNVDVRSDSQYQYYTSYYTYYSPTTTDSKPKSRPAPSPSMDDMDAPAASEPAPSSSPSHHDSPTPDFSDDDEY